MSATRGQCDASHTVTFPAQGAQNLIDLSTLGVIRGRVPVSFPGDH